MQVHHIESKIPKTHKINRQWPNILVQVLDQGTTENKVHPCRETSTDYLWSDLTLQLSTEVHLESHLVLWHQNPDPRLLALTTHHQLCAELPAQ